MLKSLLSVEVSFLDGFCSAVQGLLDWFEVDSPSFCLSRLICALSAQISFSCWNGFCLLKYLLSVEVSFSIEVSFVCCSLFCPSRCLCFIGSLFTQVSVLDKRHLFYVPLKHIHAREDVYSRINTFWNTTCTTQIHVGWSIQNQDIQHKATGLWYGVATIIRLLKIIGLFCRI